VRKYFPQPTYESRQSGNIVIAGIRLAREENESPGLARSAVFAARHFPSFFTREFSFARARARARKRPRLMRRDVATKSQIIPSRGHPSGKVRAEGSPGDR